MKRQNKPELGRQTLPSILISPQKATWSSWPSSLSPRGGSFSPRGLPHVCSLGPFCFPAPTPSSLHLILRAPEPQQMRRELGGAGWRCGMTKPGPLFRKGGTDFSSGSRPSTPPRLPAPWLARVGFVHLIWGLRSHTATWPENQGMRPQTRSMCRGVSLQPFSVFRA